MSEAACSLHKHHVVCHALASQVTSQCVAGPLMFRSAGCRRHTAKAVGKLSRMSPDGTVVLDICISFGIKGRPANLRVQCVVFGAACRPVGCKEVDHAFPVARPNLRGASFKASTHGMEGIMCMLSRGSHLQTALAVLVDTCSDRCNFSGIPAISSLCHLYSGVEGDHDEIELPPRAHYNLSQWKTGIGDTSSGVRGSASCLWHPSEGRAVAVSMIR